MCGFTDADSTEYRIHGFPRISQISTDSTDSGKKGEKKGKCDKKINFRNPPGFQRFHGFRYGFHGFRCTDSTDSPKKTFTEWARPCEVPDGGSAQSPGRPARRPRWGNPGKLGEDQDA